MTGFIEVHVYFRLVIDYLVAAMLTEPETAVKDTKLKLMLFSIIGACASAFYNTDFKNTVFKTHNIFGHI